MPKRYHITTYGCQMNKHDSERIAGLLETLGFEPAENESKADIIVVNTCSVRQSAEERIFGSQEKYFEYKKNNPDLIVAVTGCLPGRDKEGVIHKRLASVDLYFPIADLVKLPEWIAALRPGWIGGDGMGARHAAPLLEDYLSIQPLRPSSSSAFVTIQTGCDKYCSYCVVPFARGPVRNRMATDILRECRELAESGTREITLLGQAVNAYSAPDVSAFSTANPFKDPFAALLWEINQIDGLKRLYWTSVHPIAMTDEVIEALKLPKQVNFLHVPVQSGNDEVLRRMNRKYTREQYLEIIRKIKEARPNIALGTDIIVGFPGETAEQFEDTLSLYREVGFDISYNAKYSPRTKTLAYKLYSDDISSDEKRSRWESLHALMEQTVLERNQVYKDREVSVLVERADGKTASGNSSEMKLVEFPTQDVSLVGKIVPVRIVEAKAWLLKGETVKPYAS